MLQCYLLTSPCKSQYESQLSQMKLNNRIIKGNWLIFKQSHWKETEPSNESLKPQSTLGYQLYQYELGICLKLSGIDFCSFLHCILLLFTFQKSEQEKLDWKVQILSLDLLEFTLQNYGKSECDITIWQLYLIYRNNSWILICLSP